MSVQELIIHITSPEIQHHLAWLKWTLIGFTIFFLGAIIWYFFKTQWAKDLFLRNFVEFFSQKAFLAGRLARQWEKIKQRAETGTEPDRKLALMEANTIIEEILDQQGFTGDTLEERLKKAPPGYLSNVEALIEANQIRNNIVHDPDFQLSQDDTRNSLSIYEKALIDLELI